MQAPASKMAASRALGIRLSAHDSRGALNVDRHSENRK